MRQMRTEVHHPRSFQDQSLLPLLGPGVEVMRKSKVTTVSLDEKTLVISKTLPNFSHFVREALLRHHATTLNQSGCPYEVKEHFLDRCIPRPHNRPHCFTCWPFGKPSESTVKRFLKATLSDGPFYVDESEKRRHLHDMDEATKRENWQLLNIDQNFTVQESATSPETLGGETNLWGRIKGLFG